GPGTAVQVIWALSNGLLLAAVLPPLRSRSWFRSRLSPYWALMPVIQSYRFTPAGGVRNWGACCGVGLLGGTGGLVLPPPGVDWSDARMMTWCPSGGGPARPSAVRTTVAWSLVRGWSARKLPRATWTKLGSQLPIWARA